MWYKIDRYKLQWFFKYQQLLFISKRKPYFSICVECRINNSGRNIFQPRGCCWLECNTYCHSTRTLGGIRGISRNLESRILCSHIDHWPHMGSIDHNIPCWCFVARSMRISRSSIGTLSRSSYPCNNLKAHTSYRNIFTGLDKDSIDHSTCHCPLRVSQECILNLCIQIHHRNPFLQNTPVKHKFC